MGQFVRLFLAGIQRNLLWTCLYTYDMDIDRQTHRYTVHVHMYVMVMVWLPCHTYIDNILPSMSICPASWGLKLVASLRFFFLKADGFATWTSIAQSWSSIQWFQWFWTPMNFAMAQTETSAYPSHPRIIQDAYDHADYVSISIYTCACTYTYTHTHTDTHTHTHTDSLQKHIFLVARKTKPVFPKW